MSVFLENDGKSKENDELCRTKIAGIAEKNGKTSCDEWKNMVNFHSKENDGQTPQRAAPVHCMEES